MSPSPTKKKATWSFRMPPVEATSTSTTAVVAREGILINPGTALGLKASILGSPSVIEKILREVIPPANKEKVKKIILD